jgi:hypothetical protein
MELNTPIKIISRLLSKRANVFYLPQDYWKLENGVNGVGPEKYRETVDLKEYLDPSEGVLSGYLGLIVPSIVINDGNRHNRGIPGEKGTFVTRSTVIAQVGARLEARDRGDWNTLMLYTGEVHPFEKAVQNMLEDVVRHIKIETTEVLNHNLSIAMYTARCYLVLKSLLDVACDKEDSIYGNHLVITGLGLGAWAGNWDNERLTRSFLHGLCVALESIESSGGNLCIIEIAWINIPEDLKPKLIKVAKEKNILLKFTKNGMFSTKDMDINMDHLVSFAWDSMSKVGNEWYRGELDASADPAIACASSIVSMSHPKINIEMYDRLWTETPKKICKNRKRIVLY